MSVNQNNSFFISPTYSPLPIPFSEQSFFPSELSDDPVFEEFDFQANSSNGGYASFWQSTPPRIDDPFLPTTPNFDVFDEEFPLTPQIPNTPEHDPLLDGLAELFAQTPPGLDFWDGVFPFTPEIPNTPPYSPFYD